MISRSVSVAVALTLSLALMTGCPPKEEYVLGSILALSGSGKTYGEAIKRGMDLELERINAEGGIGGTPLKMVYEDSKSLPEPSREAASRLIQEHRVPAIIGGVVSAAALAIAPVAEEAEVVLLSPAASSPDITGAGDYVFRIYPSDVVEGTMMADFTLNVMEKSRIMILAIKNDYGRGLKTVFAKRYRTVPNREVVKVINFDEGKADWEDVLAEIRQLRPDAIYLVGYPQEMLAFLEAYQGEAVRVPILAPRSFDVEMLKVPAAEQVIFPRDPFTPERSDRARKFAEAFREKYGTEPNIWSANGADALRLLAEAIQAVGDRPREMQSWLSQVREWDGAAGLISFDRQGDVEKLPVISIVHEGEFVSFKQYQERAQ